MKRFLAGILVGTLLSGSVALASEFTPGRGNLGQIPTPGWAYYMGVWEPEPGVHCYTFGQGISCLSR